MNSNLEKCMEYSIPFLLKKVVKNELKKSEVKNEKIMLNVLVVLMAFMFVIVQCPFNRDLYYSSIVNKGEWGTV